MRDVRIVFQRNAKKNEKLENVKSNERYVLFSASEPSDYVLCNSLICSERCRGEQRVHGLVK